MYLELDVGGCCGLVSIGDIPHTEKQFKRRLISLVDDEFYQKDWDDSFQKSETGKPFNGKDFHGSHVLVTLASYQEAQLKYIPKLGFKLISTKMNTNSGNNVSVFIMSRATINKKLKEWRNA